MSGEEAGTLLTACPSMNAAKDEGEEILYINGSIKTSSDAAHFYSRKGLGKKDGYHADITFLNSITSSANAE